MLPARRSPACPCGSASSLALLLCLATAVAYAELSKLYPGAGSSYFFAEQAFLSKKQAFKWARIAKFMVGWASHLYYWVYPGVMVGVTALIVGYMIGQIFPNASSAPAIPSPLFMIVFCIVFAFGVAYIAFRGVGGTTGVNAAINVIQITALLIFSVMAIRHRVSTPRAATPGRWTPPARRRNTSRTRCPTPARRSRPEGRDQADPGPQRDASQGRRRRHARPVYVAADASGKPINGADGNPVVIPTDEDGKLPRPSRRRRQGDPAAVHHQLQGRHHQGRQGHRDLSTTTTSAGSVIAPHSFSYVIIQACVAILILVGFESVTAMGEEAKNAKRDIPRAVILSLVIQGGFCYLLEYFAANYFLHSGYTDGQRRRLVRSASAT